MMLGSRRPTGCGCPFEQGRLVQGGAERELAQAGRLVLPACALWVHCWL